MKNLKEKKEGKNYLNLSALRKFEKCPAMGRDSVNLSIPRTVDEWWNTVSLLFLVVFGILKEEAFGLVFERNLEDEVERFGNRAVQAVNSIIAEKHPRSLLGIGVIEGIQDTLTLHFGEQSLSTSLDLWGFRRENGKEYPVLAKFKFSPAVSKDKDIESLSQALAVVYRAYGTEPYEVGSLAFEDFPEKVVVYRISLENRVSEVLVYTKQELWDGQLIVKAELQKALAYVNLEKEVTHTPGEHCAKCPFADTCEMNEFKPENMSQAMKSMQFHKAMAKRDEDTLKAYAKTVAAEDVDSVLNGEAEVTLPLPAGEEELPFGGLLVKQTKSVTKSRKKDAPTAKDILRLLIEEGWVAGEDDDITDVKVTLTPALVEKILEEQPEWTEYFKVSTKVSTKLLSPKELKKAEKQEEDE